MWRSLPSFWPGAAGQLGGGAGAQRGRHLLVNDLNDGQMTIPGYDIAVNDYNPTAFQASNGVMTYTEGTSLVGINVNYKNGEIDWARWRKTAWTSP